MVAETAKKFEALEAQAHKIMTVFMKAGYEAVAPAAIQPASVFLDVIGETLRARTYVFTDPDGEELCLRPDLTVPTCRLHIERHSDPMVRAKYCYNGSAFRFQPSDAPVAHPREFRQAGIESFGATDRAKAEAEVVVTVLNALKAAGLSEFKLHIGDLGLFRALLDAADMPLRWRRRLMHQFWRPEAFRTELKRLTTAAFDMHHNLPKDLLTGLDPEDQPAAEKQVANYLESRDIELQGTRSLSEITESLLSIVADAKTQPLSADTANLLESYVRVVAPARAAGARLKDLLREGNIDISDAFDAYQRRLQLMADAGVDVTHAEFEAEFGRTLEYYTGFVFEVVVPGLERQSPVAGGGRYDTLLRQCGAEEDVPAVGAAIHTERLLAALTGDA
ncbi:MAG: ATP phosphoribosyltransferase regulatory subunit [Hyphomicrobiaceae bacterium]|nr:ATP phosphoribosyltransferase regulatory subunit [Hyphomicrobiaceae bacterium]